MVNFGRHGLFHRDGLFRRVFPIYPLAMHEKAPPPSTQCGVSAMRQMHSWVPTAVALTAFASLGSSAAEIDPTYAVPGYGTVVFFLNAGCVLLFGALAIIAQFKHTRDAEPISAQAYWAAR
jgi:hypothetical protein